MPLIAILVAVLIAAVTLLANDATGRELLVPLGAMAAVSGVSAMLALSLRRRIDRRTVARLSRLKESGDAAPVEVGSYRQTILIGTVTALAPEADGFLLRRVIGSARRARRLGSAERRDAALAIFALGFIAIEYRNGLVRALKRGDVPDDLVAKVRRHLVTLGGGSTGSTRMPPPNQNSGRATQ